jgi:Ca-activated chloride channel family protein
METGAVETGLMFGEPMWLWALLLVPVLAGLFVFAQARRNSLLARMVAPRLRERLAGGVNLPMRAIRACLVLAAVALVIVALAKPRSGYLAREIKAQGRDVIFAVDVSRSMLATDVNPTRLTRAKLLCQDLMRLLREDRLGVVAFAGSAFLQAPLTLDYSAVLSSIEELDTTIIPRGGSNIAAAIRTAIEAFGKAEGMTRALVILTDGEELDADGVAAAKSAAEAGVRIFTVGIGSREGSLIPIQQENGQGDFVRDEKGQPVQSKLDEKRLTEIAEAAGGFYAPLGPDVARQIYDRGIEPIELSETGVMTSRQPIEEYQWPLGAALACLAFWLLLGEGRNHRRQRGAPRARAAATAASMLLLMTGSGVLAADGLQSYANGEYEQALQDFEKGFKMSPDTEKLQFNAGAAAYKLGDYAKAVDHFTQALLAEDEKLRGDAAYNIGNALVRRGEKTESVEEKKSDWKDAIEQYTQALNVDSGNKRAEENREIVKKLLEELEKEQQKQEQQKQQQEQDKQQQQQQQEKQDQDKKEQQQQQPQDQKDEGQQGEQQGEKKDEGQSGKPDEKEPEKKDSGEGEKQEKDQPQPSKDQGDNEKQEQQQQQQQSKGEPQRGQDQPSGQQEGQEPAPAPEQGDKKEGELGVQADLKPGEEPQGEGGAATEIEEKEGEMSEAQARSLLRTMEGEEERVRLLERRVFQDVSRDW